MTERLSSRTAAWLRLVPVMASSSSNSVSIFSLNPPPNSTELMFNKLWASKIMRYSLTNPYISSFLFFFLLYKHENNPWSLLVIFTSQLFKYSSPESLKLIKYSKKPQLSKHEALQCHFLTETEPGRREWVKCRGNMNSGTAMSELRKTILHKSNSTWKRREFSGTSYVSHFLVHPTCYHTA